VTGWEWRVATRCWPAQECSTAICRCGAAADVFYELRPRCYECLDSRIHANLLEELVFNDESVIPDDYPVEFLRPDESFCALPDKFRKTAVSYKKARCIYCDLSVLRCVPRGPGRTTGFVCTSCDERKRDNAGRKGFCPVCGVPSPQGIGGRTRIYCDRHIRRNSSIRRYQADATLQIIVDRDDWTCHLCSLPISSLADATRDHIIPKSHGGSDAADNLKAAHMLCNSRRRTKPLAADDYTRVGESLGFAGL